jgi:hypothetical protein
VIGSHLSQDRLLALVEAPGSPDDPHLAVCKRCRHEVYALRRVLDDVGSVDVPEPSPLFWDVLSRRIREAVDGEGSQARPRQAWRPWLAWALSLAGAVTLALVGLVRPASRPGEVDGASVQPATRIDDGRTADREWQLLLDILDGQGARLTDEPNVGAEPGSTDALLAELSSEERAALVWLLQRESVDAGSP